MHYRLGSPVTRRRSFRLGQIDPLTGVDTSTPITIDTSGSTDTTDTSGGGTSTTPGWLNTLVTGVTQFAIGAQQSQRINQLNQINIQRAAAGLPPLDVNMVGPGVSVGISQGLSTGMWVALGIAGIFVAGQLFKRR